MLRSYCDYKQSSNQLERSNQALGNDASTGNGAAVHTTVSVVQMRKLRVREGKQLPQVDVT